MRYRRVNRLNQGYVPNANQANPEENISNIAWTTYYPPPAYDRVNELEYPSGNVPPPYHAAALAVSQKTGGKNVAGLFMIYRSPVAYTTDSTTEQHHPQVQLQQTASLAPLNARVRQDNSSVMSESFLDPENAAVTSNDEETPAPPTHVNADTSQKPVIVLFDEGYSKNSKTNFDEKNTLNYTTIYTNNSSTVPDIADQVNRETGEYAVRYENDGEEK